MNNHIALLFNKSILLCKNIQYEFDMHIRRHKYSYKTYRITHSIFLARIKAIIK